MSAIAITETRGLYLGYMFLLFTLLYKRHWKFCVNWQLNYELYEEWYFNKIIVENIWPILNISPIVWFQTRVIQLWCGPIHKSATYGEFCTTTAPSGSTWPDITLSNQRWVWATWTVPSRSEWTTASTLWGNQPWRSAKIKNCRHIWRQAEVPCKIQWCTSRPGSKFTWPSVTWPKFTTVYNKINSLCTCSVCHKRQMNILLVSGEHFVNFREFSELVSASLNF